MSVQQVTLQEALDIIQHGAGQYAREDTIGGFHPNAAIAVWPVGAIWEVEGQFLYALTRAVQPKTVYEVGTGRGCSTAHIATALKINGNGALTTLDDSRLAYAHDTLDGVTYRKGDAVAILSGLKDGSVDLIFEDLDHNVETVEAVARLAQAKLAPGGMLISHDAAHPIEGAGVREGYARAGIVPTVLLIKPSDCGFAVWVKPLEAVEEKPKKPARNRRAKTAD